MPRCDLCNVEHDEVFVHGRCHPKSATWAVITGHHITIQCATCDKEIVKLELKEPFG